jgi:SAM-dependent methyltransferase
MPSIIANKIYWTIYPWWFKKGDWKNQAAYCNQSYEKWMKSIVVNFIYKNIDENSVVVEIGCGNGRWTEYLLNRAKKVYAIDIHPILINYCKGAFSKYKNTEFVANNGKSLDFIDNESVDFVWSYLKEFSRILKKRSKAIVHHGGGRRNLADYFKNWRSVITKDQFKALVEEVDLKVNYQTQSWGVRNKFNCKLANDYISELVRK